ncbi:HNH endonuclease signature motif containing protein [Paeniglutamicibacter antarcticus]
MGKFAAHQDNSGPWEGIAPPAGSRFYCGLHGFWATCTEGFLGREPLARAVAKLTSTQCPRTPGQGLEQLRALARIRAMVDGLESTLLADTSEMVQRGMPTPLSEENPTLFDYKQEVEEHGYPLLSGDRDLNRSSLVAEAAIVTRTSERSTFNRLATAEGLRNVHERSLFALYTGSITSRTAAALVKQTQGIPRATARQIEAILLPTAATASDASMALRIKRARERLHPEAASDRRSRAETGRSLMWWPEPDGMAVLQAYLPAEDVLSIYNTVSMHSNLLASSEEQRPLGQLRADVFRDSLIEGWPGQHAKKQPPFVGLTIPALQLLTDPERGTANLEGYGPIPIGAALLLAARAPTLRAILTDPWTGSVLDLGRKRYKPSKALRDFLRVRDEHCRFPGCRRAPESSEFDHIEDWAAGGVTSTQNAQLLCKRHQIYKHVLGWRAVHLGNGSLQWRTPHGVTELELPDGLLYPRALGPEPTPIQAMLPGTSIDAQAKRLLCWDETAEIPGIPDTGPEPRDGDG